MNHLLVHINQDIKRRDKTKIRTQHYIQLITWAKEIQQLIPRGPNNNFNVEEGTTYALDNLYAPYRFTEIRRGLRLNNFYDINFLSIGLCLMLDCGYAQSS